MSGWRYEHVGAEGNGLMIGGVDVWRHEWRSTGETLQLPHPSFRSQLHSFAVREVGSLNHPIRFAVAELSAGVYGFYVPD
jgi:hypothetical protein